MKYMWETKDIGGGHIQRFVVESSVDKLQTKGKKLFSISWQTAGYIRDSRDELIKLSSCEKTSNWFTLIELHSDGMAFMFKDAEALIHMLNKKELRPASFLEASQVLEELHKLRG